MISVGIDIEDVRRFRPLVRNARFLKRVYTPKEIAYCKAHRNFLERFAVRFAAKEAAWKALSEIIHARKIKINHSDIGVKNDSLGKPELLLPRGLRRHIKSMSLSLSHTNTTVVAVAIISR